MIRRVVGWFVLLPLCALLIVFALANRHTVTVGFDPVSPQSPLVPGLSMPLYVVIYVMLITGIVLGGLAAWFSAGRIRRERRAYRREATHLAEELGAARKQVRRATRGPALTDADDYLEDD